MFCGAQKFSHLQIAYEARLIISKESVARDSYKGGIEDIWSQKGGLCSILLPVMKELKFQVTRHSNYKIARG